MADHQHQHHHTAVGNIRFAFFLNIIFTVVEIVGGIFTNSLAILSDALHDLGDTIALGISWRLEHLSERGRSSRFSYGYKRFSLLGAVTSSLILVAGSVFIVTRAVPRIIHPEEVHAEGMLILAIIGIAVNGVAVWRLHGGERIHERIVKLHLLEDVFGWVAVLAVSIIIRFARLPFLDPVLSLGISLFVLVKVLNKLIQTVRIFLQSVPEAIGMEKLEHSVAEVPEIIGIHDMHIWSLDGEYHVGTVHIVVEQDLPREQVPGIKQKVREIMTNVGVRHVTIEIEREAEVCEYKEC
jgi:cobalt-zinc-cadmium efflux system protein